MTATNIIQLFNNILLIDDHNVYIKDDNKLNNRGNILSFSLLLLDISILNF